MGNRTSRCEPGKSVCSAKWEFRNVDCAKLPNEDARDICAQSMVDCEKTECKIIAQPGRIDSERREMEDSIRRWFLERAGSAFASAATARFVSAVTGLVHHVGNSAWECNMSAGQYAVKAAFDAAVKLPVVMSCLRKLHTYATSNAVDVQKRLRRAEETTNAYLQVFEELIHQHKDVHNCYSIYAKDCAAETKEKSLRVYYKNGVKRIVEHAHSVYMQFMQRTVDVEVDASDNISVWKTDWTLNKDVAQGGETMSYLDFDRVQSELALRLARMKQRAGMAVPASWKEKATSFVSYQLFSRGLLSLCIRLVTSVASVSTSGATDAAAAMSCFVATYLSIAATMIVANRSAVEAIE